MHSNKRFKRIWRKLVGTSSEFRNINIAVTSICVISFVLLTILLLANILLALYKPALVILGAALITAGLFYYSRYKKQYNSVIVVYTIVSYFALALNFVFNFGSRGPTVLGFFLTFLILVAIVKTKYHLRIVMGHTALLIVLFATEYYYPGWFAEKYSSEALRIADWSISYILCLAFTYLVVMFLRNNYKREQILAQQRALDILVQNEKLQTLIAEKDKLFSLISHDIASPLLLIQSYLEMIGDTPIEEEAELRKSLLGLTRRTSDMLNNMLNWSKSQMKGVKMNVRSFNVNELILSNLPLYHALAEAKDIEIDISGCYDMLIMADEEMTKAIFRNLLGNAIKFTPSEGRIKLSVERNGSVCYIHITDNGIGMSEEKQKQLFTLSSKATYGTHNETGVGLGLVLSKEFAELQKGTIHVKSTKNEGSTFTVALPLSQNAKVLQHF